MKGKGLQVGCAQKFQGYILPSFTVPRLILLRLDLRKGSWHTKKMSSDILSLNKLYILLAKMLHLAGFSEKAQAFILQGLTQ